MRTFIADVRYGARALRNSPGFALLTVLSIAIGVGANAAMFSLADGLLLRPLGVPRAGNLLAVVSTARDTGFSAPGVSYPNFLDARERSRSFERLVAFREVLAAFDARPDRPALRTMGAAVSGDVFEALAIRPALGRFFARAEDVVAGRDAVLVLDHRTWVDRFSADPAVIGRTVRVGEVPFVVVGVAEPAFRGLNYDVWPAFYLPMAMFDAVARTNELARRDVRAMEIRGHRRADVTLAQARDEIATIGAQLAAEHPDANRAQGLAVETEFELRLRGPDASLLGMLVVLAIAVLIVACANVAGLLTSRAPTRTREVALRLALGAGRARIIRQLLAESLLLAGGGAAAGLVIAYGGIRLFRQIEFPTEVPLKLFFTIDARVTAIAFAVAVTTALVASLLPAWRASRADLTFSIKDAPNARQPRQWGRHLLVSSQVALSLVLVTVAAGLYAGFRDTMLKGPAYRTDRLLLMRFDERLASYDADRAERFYRLLKERARQLPGVTSVALTSFVPMKTDTNESMRVAPEGARLADDASDVRVRSSHVDEGYFPTAGIAIVAGRPFSRTDDAAAPRVVIVNETFAAEYWPDQSPLGRRVRVRQFDGPAPGDWHEVIGVARTAIYDWLGETPQSFIYLPDAQGHVAQQTLLVESDRPEALAAPLDAVARAIDPNMPIFGVRTMESLYHSRGVTVPRVIIGTVAGMGMMGLGLALAGLCGLISYAVNRRVREFGVRMAVGATPRSLLALVLRRAALLTAAGIAIGTVGALAAADGLTAAIPGIGRFDVTLHVAVAPALLAVALLAAYVPARRASKVDPLVALRTE